MSTAAVTPAADEQQVFTPQEFAGKVRAKYPGAYDHLGDDELTNRMIAKYPEYKDAVKTTFEQHPEAPGDDSLGRTVKSFGHTLKHTFSGIKDAFTAPASDEEREDYGHFDEASGKNQVTGPEKAILGVERMTYEPVRTAGRFYKNWATSGNPGAFYDDALAVAPEALGAGAAAGASKYLGEGAGAVVKNAPRIAQGLPEVTRPLRSGLAKAGDAVSAIADSDIAGAINPRAPHIGRMAGRFADVIRPKPQFPTGKVGPRFESGAFEPLEGEYLDTPPVEPASPEPPFAQAEELNVQPENQPAPYRRGQGEVPADITGTPDRGVLAGKQGVIVPKPKLLGAGIQNWEGPPPAQAPGRADYMEDAALKEGMQEDLDKQYRKGRGEESRKFEAGNSVDKPKWQREAEAKAELAKQQILAEAEARQNRPVRYTPTPRLKPFPAQAEGEQVPVGAPPDDLVPLLKKSIEQVKARKKK